ncbi:MAG: hypothetical protein ACOC0P_00905 [Planctomycetota bacterium]
MFGPPANIVRTKRATVPDHRASLPDHCRVRRQDFDLPLPAGVALHDSVVITFDEHFTRHRRTDGFGYRAHPSLNSSGKQSRTPTQAEPNAGDHDVGGGGHVADGAMVDTSDGAATAAAAAAAGAGADTSRTEAADGELH